MSADNFENYINGSVRYTQSQVDAVLLLLVAALNAAISMTQSDSGFVTLLVGIVLFVPPVFLLANAHRKLKRLKAAAGM